MRWMLLLFLAGCASTEPDHGCVELTPTNAVPNGTQVWECWGGDLPPGFAPMLGDSLQLVSTRPLGP